MPLLYRSRSAARALGYATDDVIIPNLDNNALDNRDLWLAFTLIIAVGLARGLGAFYDAIS